MWICARKHGPAPQESTLPLTKASLAAFPGVAALQRAEVSQLWCLGVPGVAPRVLYSAAGCAHVFACLLQNSTGIPAPFETFLWLALQRGPIFGAVACMLFVSLHCVPCMYIYIYVYIYICICFLFKGYVREYPHKIWPEKWYSIVPPF